MSSEDRKLKIVHVITRMDTVGGAQIHVRDVVNHLHYKGYNVQLITGKTGNAITLSDAIPIRIVRHLVRELNPLKDMKAILEMRKLFKMIGPDLVATHSSKAGVIGRIAAASLRIPVIFTAHGWSFTEGVPNPQKFVYRRVENIIGYLTSGVIAVSKYDKRLAVQHGVISEDKIVCIQNGVHDVKKSKIVTTDEPRLIMIARFDHPKKQLQLLKSLVRLKHLDWSMHFVGDGPEKEKAEHFVQENELSHKVHFEGWLRDVDDLLACSDIFILLSEYEGLPLSILEAMRSGLPIIASDVGGVKEAVSAENGILVKVNDMNGLTEALERLISNRELQVEMGARGRKHYEEKFTFYKMIEETISYYRETIEREVLK